MSVVLLETNQINPRILKCSYFNGYGFNQVMRMASRVCYDYELEYYIKSDGGIIVDDQYIPFQAGELNFRKPGQVVCGVTPYECYILCIRMCGNDMVFNQDYGFGTPQDAQPLYENALLSSLPNKLSPAKSQVILQLFKEIYAASRQKTQWDIFKQNKLIYELLYELLHQCNCETSIFKSVNHQVMSAFNYINKHFCEEINIMQLIKESGLSKAYFHKCFKEYAKTSPFALLMDLRIEKAKTLLCVTDNTISEIAVACGYFDNAYFSFLFKRHTGNSPTQYRSQHASSGMNS